MRRAGSRRTSTVPKASRVDPFGCDIGTRSFDLDPLTHIVANGDPHCFGFLINGNDVRYGPHVDSALVDLPGHLKIILCDPGGVARAHARSRVPIDKIALTDYQRAEALRRRAAGEMLTEIAKSFNVST